MQFWSPPSPLLCVIFSAIGVSHPFFHRGTSPSIRIPSGLTVFADRVIGVPPNFISALPPTWQAGTIVTLGTRFRVKFSTMRSSDERRARCAAIDFGQPTESFTIVSSTNAAANYTELAITGADTRGLVYGLYQVGLVQAFVSLARCVVSMLVLRSSLARSSASTRSGGTTTSTRRMRASSTFRSTTHTPPVRPRFTHVAHSSMLVVVAGGRVGGEVICCRCTPIDLSCRTKVRTRQAPSLTPALSPPALLPSHIRYECLLFPRFGLALGRLAASSPNPSLRRLGRPARRVRLLGDGGREVHRDAAAPARKHDDSLECVGGCGCRLLQDDADMSL